MKERNEREKWKTLTVSSATRPHQDVVGEVPHNFVGALFGRCQAASESGDVLVVPGVAVGNGGALCYAVDLVACVKEKKRRQRYT